MPSVLEIAKLAATIASGNQINQQSAKGFASQAIELWQKCQEERAKKVDLLALYARARAISSAKNELPKPKSFPASFEEVLKILMPKKRPADRMKCYRDYVLNAIEMRNVVTGIKSEIPSDQEAANWIEANKKAGFKYAEFDYIAGQFEKWLPIHEAKNRRIKGLAGAAARKKKLQENG